MPAGMLLRSSWSASHIADPDAALTLDAYKVSSGNHQAAPITLERFVDYGLWYQRSAVPDVDSRKVCSVELYAGKFKGTLEDSGNFMASRVIGAGQSALESAALLHELGAEVEVIVRSTRVHWLGWKERLRPLGAGSALLFSRADVGPAGVSPLVAAPDLLRKFPRSLPDRKARLLIFLECDDGCRLQHNLRS
ncbi:MAG TPA: FAD-dependent oxidoreductase [Candidatus Acidoferrum sp.]|nr:FAD-dependent oxidoreductase [Candidatus Acidoferrum sp.]